MSVPISQKEELLAMSKEDLSKRVVTLETFIWNLAQRYFAQDDFSRLETARERGVPIDLSVNGREALEHWLKVKGPEYFGRHFKNVDDVMRSFRRSDLGEKPPPPD